MWNFYKKVIVSAFLEFWTATDDVLTGIAIVSFIAILLSRRYGERLVATWNGISPWWSLIPIGLLVLYRLLLANYVQFSRVKAERDSMLGTTMLAEEDPKVYLEPLNAEFAATGIIPFELSNNGQRVNVAHRIRVQPITKLPSVSFEYVNHLEMNRHKKMLPMIDDVNVFQTHNILPALEKAWEKECQMTGQVEEALQFDVWINYEDVSGRKHFQTIVNLIYSPTRHIVESTHPLAFSRPESKIIELAGMDVRRLS
ncbi:MAG: hypothetical protein WAQ52_09675 [Terriglobales bacterium]